MRYGLSLDYPFDSYALVFDFYKGGCVSLESLVTCFEGFLSESAGGLVSLADLRLFDYTDSKSVRSLSFSRISS
jgi:hypothetical protein